MRQKSILIVIAGLITLAIVGILFREGSAQSSTSRYFPETKHTVKGTFLKYWEEHGGLAQQGYPLSEEFTETSALDGKLYTVQYFERAVFEKHPENSAPYDVLLSQLGTFQYKARYTGAGAPNQQQSSQNAQLFKETGFYVGGIFLDYWNTHGGLAQQGYPISNEFTEVSDLDGKSYTVQYFERAVFEMHPENQPPYNVLLSQLGTFELKKRYPAGATPGNAGNPQPVATAPAAVPTAPDAVPTANPPVVAPQPTVTSRTTNCEPVPDSRKSTISSTGSVRIANISYSGNEYVELSNNARVVDLSGWILRDKNETDQKFVFPEGSKIEAGGTVDIYTKQGHAYSFNRNGSIWNDCGDAAELLDSNGAVVATYAYGTHLLR